MFASWTAGEYGAVGATEWLEVGTAVCVSCVHHTARNDQLILTIQLITFRVFAPTGLFVLFEHESLLLR